METTFYDDDSALPFMSKDIINTMKKNMTLDLASPRNSKKQKFNCLLSSPDLNMLKLASPELERMIIAQNNGLVTTTPTPTQYHLMQKPVTEEQEVYARGFTDALAELQTVQYPSSMQYSAAAAAASGIIASDPTTTITTLQPVQPNTSTTAPLSISPPLNLGTDLHGNVPTSAASYPVSSSTNSSNSSLFIPLPIKDEPQTVPSMGNSPPMSPINMESQERIKLERKRQRNRLAASKCRKRKLERIAKLEDKVRIMKNDNQELSNIVINLKKQVYSLKREVLRHSENGCQIMTTDILNTM